MTDPKITTLPAAPSRQQPANFAARSDALLGALAGFVAETNLVIDWARLRVDEVAANTALSNAAKAVAQEMIALAPTIQGYQDNALAYKTATEAAAALTQGYKDDVASAIVYQDLAAILETKAETAAKVFVYDTSLDDDGGAWRFRCQAHDWYSKEPLGTATRGLRADFPAVVVGTVEATATEGKITLYDADDPSLPMWKTITAITNYSRMVGFGVDGKVTDIKMNNGRLFVTTTNPVGVSNSGVNGLFILDFAANKAEKINQAGTYLWPEGLGHQQSLLSTGYLTYPANSARRMPAAYFNALDYTTLDDAPIDTVSGLPVSTIGVGTDAGLGIVDGPAGVGTVIDVTHTSSAFISAVRFDEAGGVSWVTDSTVASGRYVHMLFELPDADLALGAGGNVSSEDAMFHGVYDVVYAGQSGSLTAGNSAKLIEGAIGNSGGLNLQEVNRENPEESLQAHVTNASNTGWVLGQASAVLFGDTDTTSLIESELVTNGGFDTATDWVLDGRWSISGGVANWDTALTGSYMTQTFTGLLPNTYYRVKFDLFSGDGGTIWGPYFDGLRYDLNQPSGSYVYTVKTTNGGNIDLRFLASTGTGYIDNVSVKPAVADRSVSFNGPEVKGTVNRAPVATGAQLTAVTGFSGTNDAPINYLERSFDPALSYGPNDDFCIMGWYKATTSAVLLEMGNGAGDVLWRWRVFGTNLRFDSMGITQVPAPLGSWVFVAVVRTNGVATVYINGVAVSSIANTVDLTTTDSLLFGAARLLQTTNNAMSLALWDFTDTIPNAELVAKIYRDELEMFRPESQVTLAGTSRDVRALVRDQLTGVRYAGTPADRSDFKGLVRVNSTGLPSTVIAAHGGRIVEQ